MNAGQIPQILYRTISLEAKRQSKFPAVEEPTPILTKNFAMNVSNVCTFLFNLSTGVLALTI